MPDLQAIGLIEARGMVTAVEATDAALKTANVSFLEQRKIGSGIVAVTVTGDVAAVRAALDSAEQAGNRVGDIVRVHVIPLPHGQVQQMR